MIIGLKKMVMGGVSFSCELYPNVIRMFGLFFNFATYLSHLLDDITCAIMNTSWETWNMKS